MQSIEEHVTFQTGKKFEITGVFAWFPTQKPEWNGEKFHHAAIIKLRIVGMGFS